MASPWLPLPRGLGGVLPLLLAAGCNDYELVHHTELETPLETDTDFDAEGDTAVARACPAIPELPGSSPIDESCDAEPETGVLTTLVEWSRSDFGSMQQYTQVVVAPLVGQLTDDDGDGLITRDDHPDIVVVADDDGADNADHFGLLVVLDGVDGSTRAAIASVSVDDAEMHPYRYATPALADLDADGTPEIITVVRVNMAPGEPDTGGGGTGEDTGNGTGPPGEEDTAEDDAIGPPPPDDAPPDPNDACAVAAFHADGSLLWLSSHAVECAGHLVATADLNGDGYGEVLVDDAVLDYDGSLRWEMTGGAGFGAYSEMGSDPVAIDLDVDGSPEVLDGRTVYTAEGAIHCEIPSVDPDGFPAAADLDGDGLGEFVLVGDGQVHIYEDDCTPAASWVLYGSGNGGPPTIADFDGDGTPEIGLANAEVYAVYEADGTLLWSQPCTDESSHATGSSVFDFDGDGRAEVLYGDEVALWVFDGATGAIRLEDHSHTSRTLHEFPIAADVDGDGETEIVVPQGGGHYGTELGGLYVLGSAGDPWLGDRQVWNQHAWTLTNIRDDLTLPYPAPPNWPFSNTFRSGDLSASAGGALPDAIGVIQVCDDLCLTDEIAVEVRLWNGGMGPMRAGVPMTVYAEVRGREYPLASLLSEDVVESGGATGTFSFAVSAPLVPDGILVLRVDDDGEGGQQVAECHEDNNSMRIEDVFCP